MEPGRICQHSLELVGPTRNTIFEFFPPANGVNSGGKHGKHFDFPSAQALHLDLAAEVAMRLLLQARGALGGQFAQLADEAIQECLVAEVCL